jgi:hypothetical protein
LTSAAPPGGVAATMRTGWIGKFCASAGEVRSSEKIMHAATAENFGNESRNSVRMIADMGESECAKPAHWRAGWRFGLVLGFTLPESWET